MSFFKKSISFGLENINPLSNYGGAVSFVSECEEISNSYQLMIEPCEKSDTDISSLS